MTVAIGNRLPTNPYGPSTYGGYEIDLLAGGQVIGSSVDAITPLPGTFADASFTVSSDAVNPSLLGDELSLRLTMTRNAAAASTDFDNVRLTTTAVPEPTTFVVAAGAMGLTVARLRRHRRA